ncbi:hypothetical protein RIF29_13334 [Crotalaria pallida]|uniref:F-box domain-containing protein n=1 Tax=Crotalaria pallida TaxID=3830 RepID=A0AAN9IP46_CROPI
MKRARRSERGRKDYRDRLSDLPDCVLLHIMKFLNTKQAVQTCVLSRRWKDLSKHLTVLTLHSSDFSSIGIFRKFVSWVRSRRDPTISLHNLDLRCEGCVEPKLLDSVMRYAVSHNVQQLIIEVELHYKVGFMLNPCIFSCPSLTFLKLSMWAIPYMTKVPQSLVLPSLKSLHLEHVTFSTSDNGCAEPFSTCSKLNSLVIGRCYLQCDAKVLRITNSNLSNLTIDSTITEKAYKIVLSTPNLSALTVLGDPIHELSSTFNLSLLEEVNIDIDTIYHRSSWKTVMALVNWLHVLAKYVKIMTLSSSTLEILKVVSTPGLVITQPPCFARLKLMKMKRFTDISDEEVRRIVEYLLQSSIRARFVIIPATKSDMHT